MLGPLLKFRCGFAWQVQGVAGAVQKTCSSEMLGGQRADFLRSVAFWIIRTSVSGRWFCVTGAALRMTWHQFSGAGRQTHWYEAVSAALNFPFLKDVLQKLLRFCCCQLRKLRKFRRIASFLTLPRAKLAEASQKWFFLTLARSNLEGVSQNSFVFKLADRQIDRQLHLQLQLPLHYTTATATNTNILRYITLNFITLITSNYITLQYTTLY